LGHGFVFNPGERVEGYTNFLWTALFIPILGARLNPALAAQALTLLLALAIAALAWIGARQLAGPLAATPAPAPPVTSTPFVLYAPRGSGMETALFTLLTLAAVLAYLTTYDRIEDRRLKIEDSRLSTSISDPLSSILWSSVVGVLLALAAMTRPEGV